MNNLTDIVDENKKQWKSINALTAEVTDVIGIDYETIADMPKAVAE